MGPREDCFSSGDPFDPDIAGIGVVTSFAITAVASMLLVLFAYLMGIFPGMEQSQVDILLMRSFRKMWRLLRNHAVGEQEEKRGKNWAPCFERVLLQLADQQLVTSLAIIVAAFSKWRDISVYSLDMAWTMVTMSLVTHLATVRFCPKYLGEYRFLRKARIAGVGLVIVGFTALQITRGVAMFAALERAGTLNISNASPRSVAWKMLPSCLLLQSPGLPPDLAYDIFWSVVVWLYYTSAVDTVLSQDLHGSTFLYRMLVKRVFGEDPGMFDNFENLFSSREKWILEKKSRALEPVLRGIATFEAAYFAIMASVLSDISWLLLVLTYCLTKLLTTWLDNGSPFWESATLPQGFGFGQMTALILLAIPLLTFLQEASIEGQHQHEHTSSPSQPLISAANCVEGSNSEYANENDFLKKRAFGISVYALSLWSILASVCAAVIAGVPWYDFGWNLGGTLPFFSLFLWRATLEFFHVVQLLSQALLPLIVTAARTIRRKHRCKTNSAS